MTAGAEAWVSLLIQVPLVGIFVWFTLQLTKNYQSSQEKRDTEWRDFLREQREQGNNAIGRLAEEIKCLNGGVTEVKTLIQNHDSRVAKVKVREVEATR
jgi:hypothetical protein